MKYIISTTLIFISYMAFAQPDTEFFPDFTETDINGVEHSLYADYLDQGKTVVIDIFATWCPNCTSSLPGLHELESLYGDDIVLLAFERDGDTSNEAQWAETWNVNSPIFADALETMATWNTIYQPNYFVICPDGTFELKVGAIGSSPSPLDDYIDVCLADEANSINELEDISFTIVSNPVHTTLSFDSNVIQGDYTIMSLTGESVLKGSFESSSNLLDVSHLETGLYFLRLESSGSSSIKKFIKS